MAEQLELFFTHIMDVPWFIELFAISISTVLCLGYRKGKKWFSWERLLEVVIVAASFFTISLLFTLTPSFLAYVGAIGSSLRIMVLVFLYAAIRSNYTWTNRIIVSCFLLCYVISFTFLGTQAANIFASAFEGFSIAAMKVVTDVLIVVMAFIITKYPIYKYRDNASEAWLNVVSNIVGISLILIYELNKRFDETFRISENGAHGYIVLTIIGVMAINIVTYFMTYRLCKEKKRTLDFQMIEQRNHTLNEMLLLSEQNVTELREIRHDIKNQYIYMQSMLENNKYDELKAYYEELVGTFAKPLFAQSNCGNKLVDSILNLENKKATSAMITLSTKAVLPSELPFPRAALLALFTNVIDNAIEAVQREEIKDAVINVDVGIKGGYLVLFVTNPTKKPDQEEIKTAKTEKEQKRLHGYGMKIIKRVIKDYNGIYHASIKNGLFSVECLLDINSVGEEEEQS